MEIRSCDHRLRIIYWNCFSEMRFYYSSESDINLIPYLTVAFIHHSCDYFINSALEL